MQTRPGFGETLPALLRRRYGIPERRTLAGVAVAVALLVVAGALLYDPLKGRTQRVHRRAPVFNTLYPAGAVRPVAPRPGEYQRYVARRRGLRVELAVRPLRLPAYRGDVGGVLPVYAERHRAALARTLPGFELTGEGRARVQDAPAYQTAFRFGAAGRRSTGTEVFVVPPDDPGVRDGLLVSLRARRVGRRPPSTGARAAVKDMRSIARSLMFGTDRDN